MYLIFLLLINDFSHTHELDNDSNRCRWSTLSGEPMLYAKVDCHKLNIIDTEKQELILKNSVRLELGTLGIYETMSLFSYCDQFCQSKNTIIANLSVSLVNWLILTCLLYYFTTFLSIGWTNWIDVCPTDANLLASTGSNHEINIYDRRESKIERCIDGVHTGNIFCRYYRPILFNTTWKIIIRWDLLCSLESKRRWVGNSLLWHIC